VQPTQTPQRFIIERPRLIELLDSFDSRIVLITAPAGYGKSTLARQWAAKRENVLWYEATPASRDVAALVTSLAVACRVPMDARSGLRALVDELAKPDDHAERLAEELAGVLQRHRVGENSIVAIDENDIISGSPSAARLLETLVLRTAARFVLLGRHRPPWASARKLLYGEISEIDGVALAFTEAEANQLLSNARSASARAIWLSARGWPAVIRLAALSGGNAPPSDAYGAALHSYFAEELLDAASPKLQARLPYLAALPVLSLKAVELVLSIDAGELQREAVELGFLSTSTEGHTTLHPLLRRFLIEKFAEQHERYVCEHLLRSLIQQQEWDNAFSVITLTHLYDHLPSLVASSLDQLLHEGRLKTLEEWAIVGRTHSVHAPELYLLEAELARRSGLLTTARSHALRAAQGFESAGHPWASRSYGLAGICAHLSQQSREAIEHFDSARRTARTRDASRQAIWGQFVTSNVRQDDNLPSLLAEFEELADANPGARLRAATGHFIVACAQGAMESTIRDHLEPCIDLCNVVADPLITSSFYYQLGYGYALVGRYQSALDIIARGEEQIRSQRLAFAQTHLTAARIAATIGLRRFQRAESLINTLIESAMARGDSYELPNSRGLKARLLLAQGDYEAAAHELLDWDRTPVTALGAELAALRGLALANANASQEAEYLADTASTLSRDAQVETIACAVRAIVDLRAGSSPEDSRLTDFEDALIRRENYDGLVTTYRSYPPLLRELIARNRMPSHRIYELVIAAQDVGLASSAGVIVPRTALSTSKLSPREEEVFELMRDGKTNKEIAAILFISIATAKVHVRHILEKLNVRSRTEAVLHGHDALTRSGATTADDATDSSG
jgi:ATP/maltotriose-dependent transcriptional regulator MalT